MIEYIGLAAALLWIVVGITLGRKRYGELNDELSKRQAIVRAVIWGIIRPPWLVVAGAWNIVSVGWLRKKDVQ
jgi:hypothetical protein